MLLIGSNRSIVPCLAASKAWQGRQLSFEKERKQIWDPRKKRVQVRKFKSCQHQCTKSCLSSKLIWRKDCSNQATTKGGYMTLPTSPLPKIHTIVQGHITLQFMNRTKENPLMAIMPNKFQNWVKFLRPNFPKPEFLVSIFKALHTDRSRTSEYVVLVVLVCLRTDLDETVQSIVVDKLMNQIFVILQIKQDW